MPPPKTTGAPRGTVRVSVGQNIASLTIRAVPIPEKVLEFMLNNISTMKRLQLERSTSSNHLEPSSMDAERDLDSIDTDGDVSRSAVRPQDFWMALEEKCKVQGGIWADVADKILAFGPNKAGTCMLVDQRIRVVSNSYGAFHTIISLLLILNYRLRREHEDPQKISKPGNGATPFDSHIETGFQLATFQGPLCGEPVQGLAYFLEKFEVAEEALSQEKGEHAGFVLCTINE